MLILQWSKQNTEDISGYQLTTGILGVKFVRQIPMLKYHNTTPYMHVIYCRLHVHLLNKNVCHRNSVYLIPTCRKYYGLKNRYRTSTAFVYQHKKVGNANESECRSSWYWFQHHSIQHVLALYIQLIGPWRCVSNFTTNMLQSHFRNITQITRSMGPTWGPPGSCRPQAGPMLAP